MIISTLQLEELLDNFESISPDRREHLRSQFKKILKIMTVFFDFQAFSISILEELKRDERGSKGAKEYAIE